MNASKNIRQGREIKDLRKIKLLAEERKSVVVKTNHGWIYVRAAAFVLQWPLSEVVKCQFYQSVKIENGIKDHK